MAYDFILSLLFFVFSVTGWLIIYVKFGHLHQ